MTAFAPLPKPEGKPRDLVLAALRAGADTRAAIRSATKLSSNDADRALRSLNRERLIQCIAGQWFFR